MKYLLLFCGMVLAWTGTTQEQLGLRLENYAGSSSLALNPAFSFSNPLSWDLTLAGAGLFMDNNYGYIRNTGVLDLLGRGQEASFRLAGETEGPHSGQDYIVDFYNDNRKRYLISNATGMGPALVVRIRENHTAGIFTQFRVAGGVKGVDNDFSYYKYDNRSFFDPFQVEPFQAGVLSWSEIGIHYGIRFPDPSGYTAVAVNIKKLSGYEGAFVENISGWEHNKLTRDTITIGQPHGRFGFTNSNLTEDGIDPVVNGRGFGLDIGFVKVIQEYEDGYRWRLGASLMDIGQIRFSDHAEVHLVNTRETFPLAIEDYEDFKRIEETDELVRQFSQDALGDSLASFQTDDFIMILPAAISLQADYGISENVFVNATFIQGLKLGDPGPARGSILAITPRFEKRWLSASLPVSLYQWNHIRVGLAARLGFLVIGSDDLGSLLGKKRFTGADFYMALKINPFDLGWSLFGSGGKGKSRYGKRGKVKCYDF